MLWMVLVSWVLPEVFCQGATDIQTPTDNSVGEWDSTGVSVTTAAGSSSTIRNPPIWTYENTGQEQPLTTYVGLPSAKRNNSEDTDSYADGIPYNIPRRWYSIKTHNYVHPVFYNMMLQPENSRAHDISPSNDEDVSKRIPSASTPEPTMMPPYLPDTNSRVEQRIPFQLVANRQNPYNYPPMIYPPLFYPPSLNFIPPYLDPTSFVPTKNPSGDLEPNPETKTSISKTSEPVQPPHGRVSPYNYEDIPLAPSSSEDKNYRIQQSLFSRSFPGYGYPVPPYGLPLSLEDIPLSSSSSEDTKLNSRTEASPSSRSLPGYDYPMTPFGLVPPYMRPYPEVLPDARSNLIAPRLAPRPPFFRFAPYGMVAPNLPLTIPPKELSPEGPSDIIPPEVLPTVNTIVGPYPPNGGPPSVENDLFSAPPLTTDQVLAEKESVAVAKATAENTAHPYDFGYHMNDGGGNDQHRQESSDGSGTVTGSYGYKDENNVSRIVRYIADQNGFRAQVFTNEPGVANPGSADVMLIAEAPPPATIAKSLQIKLDQEHLPVPLESLVK